MRMRKKEKSRVKHKMTYRTRRRLRRLGVFFGYLIAISLLVWISWFMWLDRFVVYSGNEARLDFNWISHTEDAVVAEPPEEATVAILYNEGGDKIDTSTELAHLTGYYVTTDDLIDGVERVSAAIDQLPEESAVMLDLKNAYGTFYYSTKTQGSITSDQVDLTTVDKLIQTVTKGKHYSIARIPAFRDKHFGLENAPYGDVLPHISGGYMWADEGGCYWMNPTSDKTMAYLISIVKELKELGFDEVVFTDFLIPDTEDLLFEGDRPAALKQVADSIVSACGSNNFAISFASSDPNFSLPGGRSRLYLTGVDPSKVQSAADAAAVADKQVNLVFLTDTNDTRFNAFSVIRPMPAAEVNGPE